METTTTPVIPSVDNLPPVQTTRGVLWPRPVGVNMNCVTCCQPVAHWYVKHSRYGGEADICALCFLYRSGWLVKEQVRRVEQVAQVIGLKRQKPLEMLLGDQQNRPRLAHVADADSVLGAIVLHDRFEFVVSRRSS